MVRIFNVYNDGTHSRSIRALDFYLRSAAGRGQQGRNGADIWVGDFNRHHPMWDHPSNGHLFMRANLEAAEEMITILNRHRMVMALRPGVPTLEAMSTKNLTRPDNVFAMHTLAEHVIRCEVMRSDTPPGTDHFPVLTVLDLTPEVSTEGRGRNFRRVNWEEFEEELGKQLEGVAVGRIESKEEMEQRLGEVMEALRRTVEAKVLERWETMYAKRWWTEELSAMRQRVKRLGRESERVIHIRGHRTHEDFRRARNDYSQAIKRVKKAHWEKWLDEVNAKTI